MKLKRWLGGMFLVLLVCGTVRAGIETVWYGNMYVREDEVILAWAHPNDDRITHYEVQAVWIDQLPPQKIEMGTTESNSYTIKRPRTGHFMLRVRSCSETECSTWAESTDPEHVEDGIPFRVWFPVPKVEGIEID